jgi:hypothetical protein
MQSWPNLRYYPGICQEVLRKRTKNLSQHNRSPDRDLNPVPLEYEALDHDGQPYFLKSDVMTSITKCI